MDGEELRVVARELRLAGRSRRQIAEALDLTQRQAERLVADLPVPAWTRRPNARDDVRARARELRAAGRSYTEIADELGVSKSTCSLWLRDMPRPKYSPERILAAQRGRWEKELAQREFDRIGQTMAAGREVGALSDRELLLIGAVLYWAEGTKSKPWARRENVQFINGDPDLVRLFIRWLRLVGVERDRLRLHVTIHETADVAAAVGYWSEVADVPVAQFTKTTLKRHKPKTRRKNVDTGYHGCVTVGVLKCAELYRRIHGLVLGVVMGASELTSGRDTVVPRPPVDIAELRAHLIDRSRMV